jgi:hypothetical protein
MGSVSLRASLAYTHCADPLSGDHACQEQSNRTPQRNLRRPDLEENKHREWNREWKYRARRQASQNYFVIFEIFCGGILFPRSAKRGRFAYMSVRILVQERG